MSKALHNAGFKDVVPLTGGLDAWRLAGLDLKPLTDFGGAREDLGEMAAMCPWSAKAPAAGKGALHDAVYLHGTATHEYHARRDERSAESRSTGMAR